MKALILYSFLIFNLFSFQVNGQHFATSNKDIIEVEAIVKKSQQKYEDAKKKVYRAEEKLIHLKKIGVLSFNELTLKEQLLKKAKDKLEQMRLLLEHNNTLISQTKSNPSFGKSVRSTAANSNAKSQRKSIQDIQQEKIERLRQQRKQTLINKVEENRNKQQTINTAAEKTITTPKKKTITTPQKSTIATPKRKTITTPQKNTITTPKKKTSTTKKNKKNSKKRTTKNKKNKQTNN